MTPGAAARSSHWQGMCMLAHENGQLQGQTIRRLSVSLYAPAIDDATRRTISPASRTTGGADASGGRRVVCSGDAARPAGEDCRRHGRQHRRLVQTAGRQAGLRIRSHGEMHEDCVRVVALSCACAALVFNEQPKACGQTSPCVSGLPTVPARVMFMHNGTAWPRATSSLRIAP